MNILITPIAIFYWFGLTIVSFGGHYGFLFLCREFKRNTYIFSISKIYVQVFYGMLVIELIALPLLILANLLRVLGVLA